MQQQAVANFQRGLLDVLMRAMGRVASLERDDFFPSALAKSGAGCARLQSILHESAAGNFFEQRHGPAEAVGRRRGDVLRARMRIFRSPEHRFRFRLAIDLVDLGQLHYGEPRAALMHEGDLIAGLERARGGLIDAKRDRNRPRRTRTEAHRVAAVVIVSLVHEAGERRERARGEHLEVGGFARAEFHARKLFRMRLERRAVRSRRLQIVELAAAVRGDRIKGY